jgi:hypothetical protein
MHGIQEVEGSIPFGSTLSLQAISSTAPFVTRLDRHGVIEGRCADLGGRS